jgi:hypothetical protein
MSAVIKCDLCDAIIDDGISIKLHYAIPINICHKCLTQICQFTKYTDAEVRTNPRQFIKHVLVYLLAESNPMKNIR